MKVNGVTNEKDDVLFGPVVFKRVVKGEEKFLVFYAQPVWDLDEFNALCPMPENKNVRYTRNGKETDPEAPAYLAELAEWNRRRWGYTVLKTLEPSNIEFDAISLEDPTSWGRVEDTLDEELGLYEFGRLMGLVNEANALDQAKLEENAKTFFQKQAQLTEKSSPSGAPESS